MTRIKCILENIDNNDLVADIGCDQIELGILLAKKNIKSVASDISFKVIEKAMKKAERLGISNYIKFYITDGLDGIDENINTLVLAGMGAYTILGILKRAKKKYDKIITISNNKNDLLRKEMLDLGYKAYKETIIYEKNKYYNLIIFTPGFMEYSEYELLLGYNHTNIETLNKYKNYLIEKYRKIDKISNGKNKKINYILKTLENKS